MLDLYVAGVSLPSAQAQRTLVFLIRRVWVRVPVLMFVSLTNHYCFDLPSGRKAVGFVWCETHVKEPSYTLIANRSVFLAVAVECIPASCKPLKGAI